MKLDQFNGKKVESVNVSEYYGRSGICSMTIIFEDGSKLWVCDSNHGDGMLLHPFMQGLKQ
jgi:hypothetical protein